MTVRLRGMTLLPRGENGWTGGPFEFGAFSTVLCGPNGSGKTPIMKAIAFGLGHEVELPAAVKTRCAAVVLGLEAAGVAYSIRRAIDDAFQVEVTTASGSDRFTAEKEFTQRFLSLFGISPRLFTGINGGGVVPYVSLLMPSFFIDQDNGWRVPYAPVRGKRFVRDQEEEILRLILALPARHPFEAQEELQAAEREASVLQLQIDSQRRALERMQDELGRDGHRRVERFEKEAARLGSRLADKRSAIASIRSTGSEFDVEIARRRAVAEEAEQRAVSIRTYIERFERTGRQIDAEVEILSANEVAAESFRQLCGNPACQFFRPGEASYGRRLLFLKDQIKDLRGTSSTLESELERVQSEIEEEREAMRALEARRNAAMAAPEYTEVVADLDALTSAYADARLKAERSRQFATERQELERLVERHAELSGRIAALRPRKGPRADVEDVRQALQTAMRRWLASLGARNLVDAEIDGQLRVHFGEERFHEGSAESGSTRTRVVLAFHAALLEVALTRGGNHLGILILDAPRQHELNPEDLREFFRRLRALGDRHERRIQVVIAVSELFEKIEEGDCLWEPAFDVGGARMFLGPAETPFVAGPVQ